MKNHSYLAAFDLDKTLLSVNSSRLLVRESRRHGYMSKKDFRQAIYYSIVYKFDLKDPQEIVLSMLQWIKGIKESEVRDLILNNAIPELLNLIRPEMLDEIAYHRDNNARIIILSSAMSYLCDPIAKHLEMDDVVCSALEVKDDLFTGNAVGKLVFGPEKEVRVKQYCEENDFPLETAWYYGDAFTDRFALQAVGNAVCVKPEIKLGWMAKRKGWKIL